MIKKVYFIGIGGIGVSALARYYLQKGWGVYGSDLVSSEITDSLKKMGAEISIGPHICPKWNIRKKPDLVIYSLAVPKNNLELTKARELKIKYLSYPQALGELTKNHFTIAVSGTHGKSTTTAMIGLLLNKANFKPTIIVGTKLKEFINSNCQVGESQYLVIEADEHFAAFLNYQPKIIVLTNIEKEHLEFYKNLNNILKTYKKYISFLPEDGVLVANKDDKNILKIIKSEILHERAVHFYSLKQKDAMKLKKILKIPGQHNVSNALAALTVARILNIPDKISFDSLSKYGGAWRRFEEKKAKINSKKIILISDYAHHPTEIKVTLEAVREKYLYQPKFSERKIGQRRKIYCVFQPHQYQRTFFLFKDFVKVFKTAKIDRIIITDIYDVAGREKGKIKEKVNSEKLVKAIKKAEVIYLPKEELINYLKKNLQNGQILIIMGAGDIYNLVANLQNIKEIKYKVD